MRYDWAMNFSEAFICRGYGVTVRKKSETEGFSGRYIGSFCATILENLLNIFSPGNFMKSITSYLDFTLMLQQAGIGKPLYEIRFGDELLGSIRMSRFWTRRAEAVSADGVWSFDRQGLFKTKITAHAQNGDIAAVYQPRSFKRPGSITIGEETYSVKKAVFRNIFDISSHFDNRVIHFQNHGIVRFRSEITFSRSVKHIQQFPLIFFFSCYILLLHRRDAKRRSAAI
jgi:hypothetical protein